MGFFDNDDFEDIVREFFGQRGSNGSNIIKNEQEERVIDFIDIGKKVFIVFEIPGYSKEDIEIRIDKREIKISARKQNIKNIQPYLIEKLKQGTSFKKPLPNFINSKRFNHDFKNGVLEIVFEKK